MELVVEEEHMELEVELPASSSRLAEVGIEAELPSFGLIHGKRQLLNSHDWRNHVWKNLAKRE